MSDEVLLPSCPRCGEPVESYENKPFYMNSVELPYLTLERRARVRGVKPEWTLRPCGDQFYRLEFLVAEDAAVVLRDPDGGL